MIRNKMECIVINLTDKKIKEAVNNIKVIKANTTHYTEGEDKMYATLLGGHFVTS